MYHPSELRRAIEAMTSGGRLFHAGAVAAPKARSLVAYDASMETVLTSTAFCDAIDVSQSR